MSILEVIGAFTLFFVIVLAIGITTGYAVCSIERTKD